MLIKDKDHDTSLQDQNHDSGSFYLSLRPKSETRRKSEWLKTDFRLSSD